MTAREVLELELENAEVAAAAHRPGGRPGQLLRFLRACAGGLSDHRRAGHDPAGQHPRRDPAGVSLGRLITQPVAGFVCESDRAPFARYCRRIFDTATLQSCEVRMRQENGRRVWMLVEASAVRDAGGQPVLNLAPQRHRRTQGSRSADARKIQLQAQLTKIAATVPGVICSFRLRPGRHVVACPTPARRWSRSTTFAPKRCARTRRTDFARMHPGDVGYVHETISASANTLTAWRADYRVIHPTRGERWIEGIRCPSGRPDGSILWHGFLSDVTERKRMEVALRDSGGCTAPSANPSTTACGCARRMAETSIPASPSSSWWG